MKILYVLPKHLENVIIKYNTCICYVYLFVSFHFFKDLNTGKKKLPKSLFKNSSAHEIEPLQVVTKRNSKCHTKVKRRLMVNDSEEENDEELARSSENVQSTIRIEVNKSCEVNDKVDIFKRTTRQKNLESSSKQNVQF